MNHKDPQLNQLYQDGTKAQPPKSIDEAILMQAKQAHQKSNYRQFRPWLAAASILFSIPFLWLLLQQPEIQQSQQESLSPVAFPDTAEIADNKKTDATAQPNAQSEKASDYIAPQDRIPEQGKITVTGSRIKRQQTETEPGTATDSNDLSAPAARAKKQANYNEPEAKEDELSEDKLSEDEHREGQQPAKPLPPKTEAAENALKPAPEPYLLPSPKAADASEPTHFKGLIKKLKPKTTTHRQQQLWRHLQQQFDHRQWSLCEDTLQQLKTAHPNIDFTALQNLLDLQAKD